MLDVQLLFGASALWFDLFASRFPWVLVFAVSTCLGQFAVCLRCDVVLVLMD